jgi:hypothetical protein
MSDDKFIDDFINEICNAMSDINVFYVKAETDKLKYVKSDIVIKTESLIEILDSVIIPNLKPNDKIFIHWLGPDLYSSILKIPNFVKVGMFFFGGEIVEFPQSIFAKENYDSLTYQFYKKHIHPKSTYFKFSFNPFILIHHFKQKIKFGKKVLIQDKLKSDALSRIDYLFHWNELDYQWIKKRYPGFKAEFKYHYYGAGLDSEFPISSIQNKSYCSIWLGNSSTLSNNHLDALKLLSRFKNENILIYCPMSYGEALDSIYTKTIIDYGTQLFKEKFVPITDFIPREQYYKLFQNIDLVVMFHNRTQAASNFFAFLSAGKKVYFKKQSTLFQLCSANETVIFDVQLLNEMPFNEIVKQLTDNEIKSNIEILRRKILNLERKQQVIKELLN